MKTQLHTSIQARRGGPYRTPAWCPWVCLLATLRSQRPGLAFRTCYLRTRWSVLDLVHTRDFVTSQWSFVKYWFTGLYECEHSSLHIGEILLADVTGTSSGKSPCRTAHRGLDVGGAHCVSLWWSHAPSAGPPPPRAPMLPPRVTRGLSSYWCATVSSPSGGPCTPIWTRLACVLAPAQPVPLSECSCLHWCSCRAVAAGYSSPVAPSALAPLVGLDHLSSLHLACLSSLFGA